MRVARAALIATGAATLAAGGLAAYLHGRPATTPEQARFRASVSAVEELRTRLRHPDGLHVDAVFTSADGSTVCIIYHAPSTNQWNDALAAVKAHGKLDAGPETMHRNRNCAPEVVAFKMDDVVAAANGPLKP